MRKLTEKRYHVKFLLVSVHIVPTDASSPEEARDKAWRDYCIAVAQLEEPGETVLRCGYSEENEVLSEIIVAPLDADGVPGVPVSTFRPDDIRSYPPRG